MDWDWHDDFQQFSGRWSVPFILQDPDLEYVDATVPPEARFLGEKTYAPLRDESALVSFAYEDYRYRFKVDTPSQKDVPWFDIHSDDCVRSDCSRRLQNTDKRSRGDITRFDAFGVGMMDRQDESLRTTGTGGEWKVALNPFYGVNMCKERPTPVDFSLVVQYRQCPPSVCRLGGFIPYTSGPKYWSNVSTWQELAFVDKIDAFASNTAAIPVEWGSVEIPEGYHIIMDVNPPLLHKITVYGQLSFLDDADRELKFENLAVQGNFTIGERDTPFQHEATLSVHGNRSTSTMVVSDSVSLGAKSIANFGEISWHGRSPAVQHTKLAKSMRPGDDRLFTMEPVDWEIGDPIVVTGTDYDSNAWGNTETGTYSGSKFVRLPGVDEVTSTSEEFVVASVASDKLSVGLDRPAKNSHFAGEIDVGFQKDKILLKASNGERRVFAAQSITYGAAALGQDPNAYLGDREVDHGWNYLSMGSQVVFQENACKALPRNTYSKNDYVIVMVRVHRKCTPRTQAMVLDAAGAKGMLLVADSSVRDIYAAKLKYPFDEKNQKIPTVVLSDLGSTTVLGWLQQGHTVSLNRDPVVLRASVGNLKRGIVVQGMVDEACTKAEHTANTASYASNCQERNLPHHLCEKQGFVPHKCYYMKGYGAHMVTGEIMYGSKDEYDDALAAGLEVRPPKVGRIWATGVNFVNFGKLATTHRGFLINYVNDHSGIENVIDKCVFRHNWQDGIVTGRASGVQITRNIFHRTLGVSVSIGDEYVNYGHENGARGRRSMKVQGVVPKGDSHVIDDNLVLDAFLYPYVVLKGERLLFYGWVFS